MPLYTNEAGEQYHSNRHTVELNDPGDTPEAYVFDHERKEAISWGTVRELEAQVRQD